MLCCYITVTLLRKEVIATENVNNEAALQTQQPELISKKELLAKFGISYGALYRRKRMGLIPEEWFIKKSAAALLILPPTAPKHPMKKKPPNSSCSASFHLKRKPSQRAKERARLSVKA